MSLQCNIDSHGKAMRLRMGIAMLIVGLIILRGWAIPTGRSMVWIIACFVLMMGAFCVFQARAGWCAMRAMGFKTRV